MLQLALEEGYDVTLEEIQIIVNRPSFKKAYQEKYWEGFKEGYAQARAEYQNSTPKE